MEIFQGQGNGNGSVEEAVVISTEIRLNDTNGKP